MTSLVVIGDIKDEERLLYNEDYITITKEEIGTQLDNAEYFLNRIKEYLKSIE